MSAEKYLKEDYDRAVAEHAEAVQSYNTWKNLVTIRRQAMNQALSAIAAYRVNNPPQPMGESK